MRGIPIRTYQGMGMPSIGAERSARSQADCWPTPLGNSPLGTTEGTGRGPSVGGSVAWWAGRIGPEATQGKAGGPVSGQGH
jgi:hypothetical protein